MPEASGERLWDSAARKEIMLIEYNDVIKSVSTGIMKKLQRFESTYGDFINYRLIKGLDEKNLVRTSVTRTRKNILEFLTYDDSFDFDESYNYLEELEDIYVTSPELKFCNVIDILRYEKAVDTIYIFTDKYDQRVKLDLMGRFSENNKVKYAWGPITKIYEKYPNITSFVLSDGEKVKELLDNTDIDYREFMLAEYAYNMTMDKEMNTLTTKIDTLKYLTDGKIFKFGLFSPVDFDSTYFTDIRNLKGE